MAMAPRIGVLALILFAATLTPTASASGCIEIEYRTFGSGLHVIANTGRQLAFGFVSNYPGEGLGAVAIITPTLCGGFGVGYSTADGTSVLDGLVGEASATVDATMVLLPLP